jgi:hypothetical protein
MASFSTTQFSEGHPFDMAHLLSVKNIEHRATMPLSPDVHTPSTSTNIHVHQKVAFDLKDTDSDIEMTDVGHIDPDHPLDKDNDTFMTGMETESSGMTDVCSSTPAAAPHHPLPQAPRHPLPPRGNTNGPFINRQRPGTRPPLDWQTDTIMADVRTGKDNNRSMNRDRPQRSKRPGRGPKRPLDRDQDTVMAEAGPSSSSRPHRPRTSHRVDKDDDIIMTGTRLFAGPVRSRNLQSGNRCMGRQQSSRGAGPRPTPPARPPHHHHQNISTKGSWKNPYPSPPATRRNWPDPSQSSMLPGNNPRVGHRTSKKVPYEARRVTYLPPQPSPIDRRFGSRTFSTIRVAAH